MKQQFGLYEFMLMFVALGLTSVSGYLSVTGIGMLFGINEWPIIVMAIFLELGKIMSASAAYKFDKNELSWWIKPILVFFTIVIMFVSSLSIFGYLSSNYEDSRIALEQDTTQVSYVENQIENVNEQIEESGGRIQNLQERERGLQNDIDEYEDDLEQINNQIDQLSEDISNGVPGSWTERQSKRDQRQQVRDDLDNARSELDQLRNETVSNARNIQNELRAERDSLNGELNELRQSNTDVQSTLGPLLFVSRTIGIDTDDAVLYFIFIIIFVFDPMAVILVVVLTASQKQNDDIKNGSSNDNKPKKGINKDQPVAENKKQVADTDTVKNEQQSQTNNDEDTHIEAEVVKKRPDSIEDDPNDSSIDRMKSYPDIEKQNGDDINNNVDNTILTGTPKEIETSKKPVETMSPIDSLFSTSSSDKIVLMKQVPVDGDNKITENDVITTFNKGDTQHNEHLSTLYTIKPDGRIETRYV